jgi:hypothetical protein
MKKFIIPVLALSLFNLAFTSGDFTVNRASGEYYNDDLIYYKKSDGKYAVIDVNEESEFEMDYRVYGTGKNNEVVDEIFEGAFDDCDFILTLMISNKITTIPEDFFENLDLTTIYFTGSESEWNTYNFTTSDNVKFYACDEGFINYWNTYIRSDVNTNICDISTEVYDELLRLYNELEMGDYERVNAYEDKSGSTIEESMEYLDELFNPKEKPKQEELPRDTTLALVVVIAIFGMSSIAIFYLLKQKDIIH